MSQIPKSRFAAVLADLAACNAKIRALILQYGGYSVCPSKVQQNINKLLGLDSGVTIIENQ